MLNWIFNFIGSEAWSFIISAILVGAGVSGKLIFSRITRTLEEAGEFLYVLGDALEDKKVTREELVKIIKEGKDVLSIWKTTPDKYKTK